MVMMALVWAGIAAAVGWMVMISWRERGAAREQRKREHQAVKDCLNEDVSALDEDLWRLGRDLADAEYDGDARRDYERAVAINDAVRRSVDQLRSVILADAMTEALAEARYAMACARSRLAGEPIPERRPPCFFNPRHGPSVTDVRWPATPDDPLEVPACAADAARIDAAEEPDGLKVWTGSDRLPYWAATVAFYAYAAGYFSGDWAGSEEGALTAIKASMVGGAPGVDGTPSWGIEMAGGGGCGGDAGGGGGC
jgi:hypothetical protein